MESELKKYYDIAQQQKEKILHLQKYAPVIELPHNNPPVTSKSPRKNAILSDILEEIKKFRKETLHNITQLRVR